MKTLTLLFLTLGLLVLSGCSDEQIRQLEGVVKDTQAKVEQSEDAIDQAEAALKAAKQLADQLGIERARPVIAQAEQAVAVARDAHVAATATADAAAKTMAAAKQAQEAGGGTFGVILAGVLAFVTGGAAALPAITKAIANGRALVQTVRGLDAAREAIGEAEWKAKVAPNLAASQDESTKKAVRKAQL